MKRRRLYCLLILLLSYIGSVGGSTWMAYAPLRCHHHHCCAERHECRHENDGTMRAHDTSLHCDCCHADEQFENLYISANGDDHRYHQAPVFALPPFRTAVPSEALFRQVRRLDPARRKIPLAASPQIRLDGLRAPPAMA